MKKVLISLVLVMTISLKTKAEQMIDTTNKVSFFTPESEYSKKRMQSLIGFWSISYSGFSYGLYQSWYKNQSLQPFHLFNDSREWQQMDKAGHMFSGYFQMAYNYNMSKWTGLDSRKSLLYSSAISTFFLTTLEFFDGFGEGWGFSIPDMASNIIGTSSFYIQQTFWDEQRILIKESVAPRRYSENLITVNGVTTSLEERAKKLYGNGLLQRALKDYNVQTYWLSISPHAFGLERWPSWLNISIGYGAEGMFGGLNNIWQTSDGLFDFSQQKRYRQFYLAPDINLNKIKTGSPFLKSVFSAANIIKTPTPALEYNIKDGFVIHLIFF